MTYVFPADLITPKDLPMVGGKAYALAVLSRAGFEVPSFLCISTNAYRDYIDRTGLKEKILLELHRKEFKDMRWEEIWDCATRIRNLFLRTPMPDAVKAALESVITQRFEGRAVVVRSSAPDEDTVAASFAGLHESFVHIRGTETILEHIQKVWASLWSDSALLYRRELGLDAARSAMAVVVQELVIGEKSGVAFSRSPNESSHAVIEAVHGLNQGLVDGQVAPDRYVIDRDLQKIISHTPTERTRWLVAVDSGIDFQPLPGEMAVRPPLSGDEVQAVFLLAKQAEAHFGVAQDVEWTFRGSKLYLLQSRPITTRPPAEANDQRAWYLSLHRSFENLKELREKIENEHIPAMIQTAAALSAIKLGSLSEGSLAAEIRRRREINTRWVNIYWSDFIPFAHGIRLFGQVYNDALKPEDPYAFLDLLVNTDMAGLERNQLLAELADQVRRDSVLADCLRNADCEQRAPKFRRSLERFIGRFGDLSCAVTGGTQCDGATRPLAEILLKMASQPLATALTRPAKDLQALSRGFLAALPADRRQTAAELLDLARSSYRMRDDDNIHIGRIESHLIAAVNEGRRRLESDQVPAAGREELKFVLETTDFSSKMHPSINPQPSKQGSIKPRQLIGQPAGPGLSRGTARVIRQHADLADFANGEILVCDAVDPNMTFVVPLAVAVVESRGGMLIHGAIIAREYGLPCVTGVTDLTSLIQTGDLLTVDGYLGIVTVGTGEL